MQKCAVGNPEMKDAGISCIQYEDPERAERVDGQEFRNQDYLQEAKDGRNGSSHTVCRGVPKQTPTTPNATSGLGLQLNAHDLSANNFLPNHWFTTAFLRCSAIKEIVTLVAIPNKMATASHSALRGLLCLDGRLGGSMTVMTGVSFTSSILAVS